MPINLKSAWRNPTARAGLRYHGLSVVRQRRGEGIWIQSPAKTL